LIRGIFFDLDGTLIDSFQAITSALNLTRAHYDKPPLSVEETKRHIGGGIERLIREGVGESCVEEGVPVFRGFYSGVHLEETTLFPGVFDTLQTLSDHGYRLGVATNKALRFSREVLGHLGLLPFITHVIAPEMVERRKPDREMLDWLMRRYDITADETLYIGDMVIDIEFARNAGTRVWVVPTGCASISELEDAKPDKILEHFGQIPEALENC
jgi:phosphoglycolate phosphatase